MTQALVSPPPSKLERSDGPYIRLKDAYLRYPIGPYVSPSVKSDLFSIFDFKKKNAVPKRSEIAALKNISLTLEAGDRLGICGVNGSGKSSLLRLLAGIYPPSSGKMNTKGKVQALFDIGLGFEPDATGRENIVYRGLAMGCSKGEIAERTPTIVDFADIGEFMDLPMRTYSSGMIVRLGFAISTYLSGEILLIDEVFAAGDATFQARALHRMNGLVNEANIVVIAGHDMALIRRVCPQAIWLHKGDMRMFGDATEVTRAYEAFAEAEARSALEAV